MKKTLKRTCAIALAFAATAGITGVDKVFASNKTINNSNQGVAYAATEITNDVLSISNYQKTTTLGATYTMPTAKYEGSAVPTYKVIAPSGAEVTVTGNSFLVSEIGAYTITYYDQSVELGSVTIMSSVSDYSISLKANDNKILPSKVGTNFSGVMNFPEAIVKDEDGEIVDKSKYSVKVTLTTPSFSSQEITADAQGNFSYNFAENELKEGTYIVRYAVYNNGHLLTKTSTEFKCVSGDAYDASKDLVITYSKERPTSIDIGKTIELPAVTAKIGDEAVPVYYDVQVYKAGSQAPYTGPEGTTVLEKNENGIWEFTARDAASFYTVKYTVKTALEGKEPPHPYEFVINTVKDTIKPTPIVVNKTSYNTENTAELKNEDYALASTIDDADVMKILPIYAEDLASTKFSEFKFLRQIKNSSYEIVYEDTENPNKTLILNAADSYVAQDGEIVAKKDNKNVKLSTGTYYAYYTVTDAAGNENTINHKFVVDADYNGSMDEYANEIKPVVEIKDTFFNSIDKGEKIEFSNVEFKDDFDTRLQKEVYYVYNYVDQADAPKTTAKQALELKDGKYVIDTNNFHNIEGVLATDKVQSVVISASATNDAGFTTIFNTDPIAINSGDKVLTPPILTDDSGVVAAIDIDLATQVDPIEIPAVEYEFDQTGSLNVDVNIVCDPTDANAESIIVDAYDGMGTRFANVYEYQGAKFVAAVEGTYKVAVKATDSAGNIVIKFFTYNVTDSTRNTGTLRFTNIGLSNETVELGEVFKLPKASIEGTGSGDYEWDVRKISGPDACVVEKDRFVANKTGDYELEYYMYKYDTLQSKYVIEEDQSVKVKISVEDTKAPEIHVDWQTTIVDQPDVPNDGQGAETIIKTTPVQVEEAYKKGTKILIPMYSASDLSGLNLEESTITISCSKTNSPRVIKYKDMAAEFKKGTSGQMYYEFATDGEYTITYNAKDNAGKSSTKSYTIKVGDTDAPELTVAQNITKSKYKIGDGIKIDLTAENDTYFTIHDAVDQDIKKTDITVKLLVNGVDKTEEFNKSTEKHIYDFKFEEAGEYELVFTVKDGAKNQSEEVVRKFTIAEKSQSSMTKTEVVGTVLIVLSVVVLAGVIVYFVISKKKMDKLYKS